MIAQYFARDEGGRRELADWQVTDEQRTDRVKDEARCAQLKWFLG
jgi:hypothetical protein